MKTEVTEARSRELKYNCTSTCKSRNAENMCLAEVDARAHQPSLLQVIDQGSLIIKRLQRLSSIEKVAGTKARLDSIIHIQGCKSRTYVK
jgi:hypothetical protein